MRNIIPLLPVAVAVIILCGCRPTESYRENPAESEPAAPQSAEKELPPATPMDPDLVAQKKREEEAKPAPAEVTIPQPQPATPETPVEPANPPASLAQMRKDLDTTMAELKNAIFEERDPFAAQAIATKFRDLFDAVASVDTNDPKLYDLITKVKDNFIKVLDYLGAQQISGAKRYFAEMEKNYQEWKAQMK